MGAVHGVYLKYVGLSALSYAGCVALYHSSQNCSGANNGDGASNEVLMNVNGARFLAGFIGGHYPHHNRGAGDVGESSYKSYVYIIPAAMLGYSAIVNGSIAVLFRLRRGMGMLGKDIKTGQIPFWSYVIFFPFHIPTIIYTYIHTKYGTYTVKAESACKSGNHKSLVSEHSAELKSKLDGRKKLKAAMEFPVPVASEVLPGWWIGGRYSHQLHKNWSGVIDLTVEFPELCQTENYLLVPIWDGVPPSPSQLDEAAIFATEARRHGDVLVHCAHGRGRSTTLMCAAVVKAGLFKTWKEAFEAMRPQRPVIKLNSMMRSALSAWQRDYVDGKKTM